MLDLKEKHESITNPVALTQVMSVEEGSDLRFFEIIRSEGKDYLRVHTLDGSQVSELEEDAVSFVEGYVALKGDPTFTKISYKCSKNAGWVIFALAELKKRLHLDSLLHGTKEVDVFNAPINALKEIEDLAFKDNKDFRMPMGFYQMYLGENQKPDLEAAFNELREGGFLKEDGTLSVPAASIITCLANIHSTTAVDSYKEAGEGKVSITKAVYLNCYHSLWLLCPPDDENQLLITTITADELKKDLKSIFA